MAIILRYALQSLSKAPVDSLGGNGKMATAEEHDAQESISLSAFCQLDVHLAKEREREAQKGERTVFLLQHIDRKLHVHE